MIPTGQQAFALDTALAGYLLFEQVQSDMAQQSQVFGSMILPHPAAIFIKGNIQGPMQLILDAPMRAYRRQDPFGTGSTGEMIAVFTGLFCANPTLGSDPRHGDQVFPVGKAPQVTEN